MIIRYATVTQSGNNYKVKFFGEESSSETVYKKLATYQPATGDIVAFIIDTKGKYLCIGKVG